MQLAEPAVQLFGRQSTYRGGWPQGFISDPCPADAPVKCQPFSSYNLNCCPSSQICSSGWPVHCCPTDGDCEAAVRSMPVCANSTWTMYHIRRPTDDVYFCCPEGMVGIIPSKGATGICQEKGPNIPSTTLAPVASQFGAAAATADVATSTRFSGNAGNGDGTGGSEGTGTGSGSSPGETSGNGNGNNNSGGDGPAAESNGSSGSGGGGSGGISAGAIAGIVVGGVAFFALVIALILWLHRRSLRKRAPAETGGNPPALPQEPLKPVGATQVYALQGQYDAAGMVQYAPAPTYSPPPQQHIAEVAGVSRVAEMEAPRP